MGSFKLSVVNAGQRNVNVAPQIIATSTKGSFRLTGPAAEALGVAPGDYVMFLKGSDDAGNVVWAVAKGYAMKNSNGTLQTCKPYGAKAYVEENFNAVLEQALASGNEKLIEALTVEGISHDAQVELLSDAMTTTKYQGSKSASPSKQTGIGATVTFTDNNIWSQIKSDVDDPESINRVFSLDPSEIVETEVSDGHGMVTIKALVLGESVDEAPARQ